MSWCYEEDPESKVWDVFHTNDPEKHYIASSEEEAMTRVNYLNGGLGIPLSVIQGLVPVLRAAIEEYDE